MVKNPVTVTNPEGIIPLEHSATLSMKVVICKRLEPLDISSSAEETVPPTKKKMKMSEEAMVIETIKNQLLESCFRGNE